MGLVVRHLCSAETCLLITAHIGGKLVCLFALLKLGSASGATHCLPRRLLYQVWGPASAWPRDAACQPPLLPPARPPGHESQRSVLASCPCTERLHHTDSSVSNSGPHLKYHYVTHEVYCLSEIILGRTVTSPQQFLQIPMLYLEPEYCNN